MAMNRKSILVIAVAAVLTPPTIGSVVVPTAKIQPGAVEAAPLQAVASQLPIEKPVAAATQAKAPNQKHPCLRHAVPVKAPKRESITDDMEKKYEAALNTAIARSMVTRKCLLDSGQ